MYAQFKGTPAERSKGRKVSLAEQDQLLTWSSPAGLSLTLTVCASQCMPECVQVKAYSMCLYFPDAHRIHACYCVHVCICMPVGMRACLRVGNEVRHGCVIHISSHDRGRRRVPGKRSKALLLPDLSPYMQGRTMLLGSRVN